MLVPSGELMTDNGPVNLSAVGDTLFLRRFDYVLHVCCTYSSHDIIQYSTEYSELRNNG